MAHTTFARGYKIATGETRVLLVSELKLWGDPRGLLGFMLAGNSAGRLGDTLSRLCAHWPAHSTVGATPGSLMRAHEGAGHRIARLLGDAGFCHSERRRIHATFYVPERKSWPTL